MVKKFEIKQPVGEVPELEIPKWDTRADPFHAPRKNRATDRGPAHCRGRTPDLPERRHPAACGRGPGDRDARHLRVGEISLPDQSLARDGNGLPGCGSRGMRRVRLSISKYCTEGGFFRPRGSRDGFQGPPRSAAALSGHFISPNPRDLESRRRSGP